jgi:hypothetical protein
MKFDKRKNDFEKMCQQFDLCSECEDFEPIIRAKILVYKYVGNDQNKLLQLKAEARNGDYYKFYSILISTMSILISIWAVSCKIFMDFNIVSYLIIPVFIAASGIFSLFFIKSFNNVGHWREYIIVVIEEMEKNKEKSGSFYKRVRIKE